MRARLHRFLLMLLMLALPLQALAAASMLDCMLLHEAAPLAPTDAMVASCHESEPAGQAPEQHDCKHCAACMLGPALPAPMFDGAAITPVPQRYAAQPAATFSGFVPDGPERPPRPDLA